MHECSANDLQRLIHAAFQGVVLGDGVSLLQAEIIDMYGAGLNKQQFIALKQKEITDDWKKIPPQTIQNFDYVPYLDAAGFRYYIPALMLETLRNYACGSMQVIGTLRALCPQKSNWEHCMEKYSLLSVEQKRAIAWFVNALPILVDLDAHDWQALTQAYAQYWCQFMEENG